MYIRQWQPMRHTFAEYSPVPPSSCVSVEGTTTQYIYLFIYLSGEKLRVGCLATIQRPIEVPSTSLVVDPIDCLLFRPYFVAVSPMHSVSKTVWVVVVGEFEFVAYV